LYFFIKWYHIPGPNNWFFGKLCFKIPSNEFLGNIEFLKSKSGYLLMQKYQKEYGPVYLLRLLVVPIIVLSDPESQQIASEGAGILKPTIYRVLFNFE
jgi:hypothetical protein